MPRNAVTSQFAFGNTLCPDDWPDGVARTVRTQRAAWSMWRSRRLEDGAGHRNIVVKSLRSPHDFRRRVSASCSA